MIHSKFYYINNVAPLGRLLYILGAVKLYANGDGVGFVWRYYHPCFWVGFPALFVINVLFEGLPSTMTNLHHLGVRMNPYFIKNPNKLKWLKDLK